MGDKYKQRMRWREWEGVRGGRGREREQEKGNVDIVVCCITTAVKLWATQLLSSSLLWFHIFIHQSKSC
jgi:hypothetical protein